jgi:hypothetical protein
LWVQTIDQVRVPDLDGRVKCPDGDITARSRGRGTRGEVEPLHTEREGREHEVMVHIEVFVRVVIHVKVET